MLQSKSSNYFLLITYKNLTSYKIKKISHKFCLHANSLKLCKIKLH